MEFPFDERLVDSPFVDAIWRGQTQHAGSRLAPAGSCWVMLFERKGRRTRLSIAGPMSKAMSMPYEGDVDFFAVKFKPGTFMPHLPSQNLLDAVTDLPDATGKSFWLNGSSWQFPNYENVETFVGRLVRNGLLMRDKVVEAALEGQPLTMSLRSVQRRFLHATGLTQSLIHQISRARQAMKLLQNGTSIPDVIHQVGYTDQPHMTKSLKHFIGQTPAQIVRTSQSG